MSDFDRWITREDRNDRDEVNDEAFAKSMNELNLPDDPEESGHWVKVDGGWVDAAQSTSPAIKAAWAFEKARQDAADEDTDTLEAGAAILAAALLEDDPGEDPRVRHSPLRDLLDLHARTHGKPEASPYYQMSGAEQVEDAP